MLNTMPAKDREVIQSFLHEEFRVGRSEPPPKWGLRLDLEHPAYGVLRRQVDAAAEPVRAMEDFLNRSGTLCMPVLIKVPRLTVPSELETPRDVATQHRVLGVTRFGEKWRIVIYSWISPPDEHGLRIGRRRKPWLESSLPDRVATLSLLPRVLQELERQTKGLMLAAEKNDDVLAGLAQIRKSIPTA